MNIQIFGTSKSFDTKKAQRYFSDRKIRVQYVDLKEKTLSRGEFNSVKTAVGGYKEMIDEKSREKDLLSLITYLTDEAAEEKLFENQSLLRTPIVRNGKNATIGYCPEIWKKWD